MKKIITSAVAASLLLGSTASAVSAQALDRDAAAVSQSEKAGTMNFLVPVLVALIVIVGIVVIESGEDEDLPTSP
jgi:hypothetical protein